MLVPCRRTFVEWFRQPLEDRAVLEQVPTEERATSAQHRRCGPGGTVHTDGSATAGDGYASETVEDDSELVARVVTVSRLRPRLVC